MQPLSAIRVVLSALNRFGNETPTLFLIITSCSSHLPITNTYQFRCWRVGYVLKHFSNVGIFPSNVQGNTTWSNTIQFSVCDSINHICWYFALLFFWRNSNCVITTLRRGVFVMAVEFRQVRLNCSAGINHIKVRLHDRILETKRCEVDSRSACEYYVFFN